MPLFVPAGTSGDPQGVLRILNDSDASGTVTVYAIDDAGTRSGPATFTLNSWAAAEFDATVLANGNATTGLTGSLGTGTGDWRLEIGTDLPIEPLAYVRAADGTLSVMHDTVRGTEVAGVSTFHVSIFNPSTNVTQASRIRLINPGDAVATVTIGGRDDTGAVGSGGQVQLTIPANGARTLTAQQLEAGDASLTGQLGAGVGRWRLSVSADRPIQVVNVAVTSAGVWNNLSTTAVRGPAPADHGAFNERFDGLDVVYETDGGRFTLSVQAGDRLTETGESDGTAVSRSGGYLFAGIGPDAGRLRLEYDDGNACAANFYFASPTSGWFASHCTGSDHPEGSWLGGTWYVDDGVDTSPVFGDEGSGDRSYRTGTAIDALTLPEASGGDGTLRYSLSPEVPGLSFDGETRELSGTPTEAGAYAMTYMVTDADGDTDTLSFSITVVSSDAVAEGDCYVGLIVAIGESCAYPGTVDGFSVNVRGRGRFLNRLAGIRIRINNETIGGRVYDFEASHQGDGVWRIDRVAGRTEPPSTGDNDGDGMETGTGGGSASLRTSYLDGALISTLPSGNWIPDATSDAEAVIGDEDVEIEFNSGGYIEEGAYRYTCAGVDGCAISNRTVLSGPIVQSPAGEPPGPVSPGSEPEDSVSTGRMAEDRAVLEALYHATGSANWRYNDNWLSDAPLGEWYGITTDSSGRVTRIELVENRLTGPIPPELGQLDELHVLALPENELTGPIPPELGQLDELQVLALPENELTGSIPPELGQLDELQVLVLAVNELTGSIPVELGNLRRLEGLSLANTRLTGPIPPELGDLHNLRQILLMRTRLTGTIPWVLWERAERGELEMYYDDTYIHGLGPPPERVGRLVFPDDPATNGNAAHHSVSHYQGPLVWSWDWRDEAVQYVQPILGRWAAIAVRIEHDVAVPPLVITRVLDGHGTVLDEQLGEAAPPTTEYLGSFRWRTEYVFDLPGALYQAGNQLVHVIDPDDELAETDETDNVSKPVRLYGVQMPPFRITFVPLYYPGHEAPIIEPSSLMARPLAYWPIADDFKAVNAAPIMSAARHTIDVLDQVLAQWNVHADPYEFYHGVFFGAWPGADSNNLGGFAEQGIGVAVSSVDFPVSIPHELGHNLSLGHPRGCLAGFVDEDYPYPDGGLGDREGWDVNWRRFVSGADGSTDVMSYCGDSSFVSDYNYTKALKYRLLTGGPVGATAAQPLGQGVGGPRWSPQSADQPPTGVRRAIPASASGGGLALSGRVDASGAWSLTHAQGTEKGPRAPWPDGEFTLILFDADGVELYREPLSVTAFSHGGAAGWAARTPEPARSAREVVILNAQGETVLSEALPTMP